MPGSKTITGIPPKHLACRPVLTHNPEMLITFLADLVKTNMQSANLASCRMSGAPLWQREAAQALKSTVNQGRKKRNTRRRIQLPPQPHPADLIIHCLPQPPCLPVHVQVQVLQCGEYPRGVHSPKTETSPEKGKRFPRIELTLTSPLVETGHLQTVKSMTRMYTSESVLLNEKFIKTQSGMKRPLRNCNSQLHHQPLNISATRSCNTTRSIPNHL